MTIMPDHPSTAFLACAFESGYITGYIFGRFIVSATSQKRALRNYRRRLNERGMARFEVLGLDADRELIRSLAKRLTKGDRDANGIRATLRDRKSTRLNSSH